MSTSKYEFLKLFENLNDKRIIPEVFPFVVINRILNVDKSFLILLDNYEESKYFFDHIENFINEKIGFLDSGSDDNFFQKLFTLKRLKKNIVTQKKIEKFFYPEEDYIKENEIFIKKGERIDIEDLLEKLERSKYERVDNVLENGEYALRGFILDIFPYSDQPYRIEFEDDTVQSIRIFNLESQLSIQKVDMIYIPPAYDLKIVEEKNFKEFFSEFEIIDFSNDILNLEPDFKKFEPIPEKFLGYSNFKTFYENNYSDYNLKIFCSSKYEKDRIEKLSEGKFDYYEFNIYKGFISHISKEIYINDFELFNRSRTIQVPGLKLNPLLLEELDQLENGDPVVHQNYGIGIFSGIESIEYNGKKTDCIKIVYADNDKLFVPVDQIYLVDKYVGDKKDKIKLSSLKSNSFAREKERIKNSIKNIARELLRLYAERDLIKGFQFKKDDLLQIELEEKFEFEETEDQLRVIEEIKKDMEDSKPMDRLVVGEVGYGKTEVALRAAFKAVLSDKQVAVLAPTTVLAQQHFETFFERLKDFGVRVEVISRFKSEKEKKILKEELKKGRIDIIIGTHALLSKNVEFKDLGLLIIDEEHKFGVKQKERLKVIKKNIDVLSLSATPIPRTLEISLMGIRDISSINTPPFGRKNIKTSIMVWDEEKIRYGILKEVDRGGQVYFINNRIENIKTVEHHLSKLVPEIKIITLHAKMPSKFIDTMMHRFKRKEFDLLLSTSIVESGIDNPNVNTIFINNAEKFGLAELHQLRGRIGRSEREGFCYLIIPSKEFLNENSRKRLSIFSSYPSLGAGLSLALKDIEIRGAGKILGTEQHGFIGNVGYSLYFKLLNEAIGEIKGNKKTDLIEPTIIIPFNAYISEKYELSRNAKIKLYHQINSIDSLEMVEKKKSQIKDIYGGIYYDVENLFKLREMKILCKKNKISKIEYVSEKLLVEFYAGFTVEKDFKSLRRYISPIKETFEIFYDPSFTIVIKLKKGTEPFEYAYGYLKKL